MFERFTDRARRVVDLARKEAAGLHHASIGTEHLLLALIREGEGVAHVVLDALGVTYDDARQFIVRRLGVVGVGGPSTPSSQIEFGVRAKKALELSLREALQVGHNYIGTEHILLGILREGGSAAALTLVDQFELELGTVRLAVMEQLSKHAKPEVSAGGGTSLQLTTIDEKDHTGALLGRRHALRGLRHVSEVRIDSDELLELRPLLEQACELLGGYPEDGTEEQLNEGE